MLSPSPDQSQSRATSTREKVRPQRLGAQENSPRPLFHPLLRPPCHGSLKAWKALERGQQPRRFRTWIRQIALNNLTDYWRKPQSRQSEPLEDSLNQLGAVDNNIEDRILLEQLLARLPEELRHIVVLHFYQDLSLADISEVMDIPLGTVKSRLARAYRLMQSTLASWEEGEGYHVRQRQGI